MKWVGRSVGKLFFLLKFPTDGYFWILVAEAGKMLFLFQFFNTESFIQKKKIRIKIEQEAEAA